ncbi:hypothetical protein PV325_000909 [Microctonus aethiopoides]|uniref:Ubiquitin-protein ligase E3C n=1 Tax=Microctonus aethiopoides TaxID=144406 RepID=A0AA39C5F6_9HYME|nr:hypothetical protein PV325_000909 [Microctonus aethiopoides]KAK0158227.1 hypothetical protein PV328_009259 [Microctonus aethiopoides]
MYSFEGDYRRKPQQNLAGASKRNEKAVLLQHAHLERMKREEYRQRNNAAIKIQAQTRSFLARQLMKKAIRCEFDNGKAQWCSKHIDIDNLVPFVRALHFFYNSTDDSSRFIWLLEHILPNTKDILKKHHEWQWKIKWILKRCLNFLIDVPNRRLSTIPLRVLETFLLETNENIEGLNRNAYLRDVLSYLVEHRYIFYLHKLLEEQIESSSNVIPSTTRMNCYMNLLKQPLDLCKGCEAFYVPILKEFIQHILMHQIKDSVKSFIISSLKEMKNLPYAELLNCINRINIQPNMNLLSGMLALEPIDFLPSTDAIFLNYFHMIASVKFEQASSRNVTDSTANESEDDDNMSTDSEVIMVDQSQEEISKQCIALLNDEDRVNRILAALNQSDDPLLLEYICQLCDNLLQTDKLAGHKYRLIYMLAFKPTFLRRLWSALLSPRCNMQLILRGIAPNYEDSMRIAPLLSVFCSLFSLLIATLHDSEFFVEEHLPCEKSAMPFTTSELVPLSAHLKDICLGLIDIAFTDTRATIRDDYKRAVLGSMSNDDVLHSNRQDTKMYMYLFKVTAGLLRQLNTRDLRRRFCPDDHWISHKAEYNLIWHTRRVGAGGLMRSDNEANNGPPLSTKEIRTLTILRKVPFIVPFTGRILVLQSLVHRDKMEHRGEMSHFMQGPSIQISVRRNYLYEDALDKLSPENEPDLRLKMRVQLINSAGVEEAGVDGGGLFREFLTELLKTSFDPNRGFFRLTKDNMLYPNPTVHLLIDDFPKHYYFIGRMLGKAFYEDLLVELPFAEFFLSKIVGKQSDVDIHHLDSLDPVMYRNLLYLKNYKGDVADLGLDFTVLSDELGERRVDELKPKGSQIPVTNTNRIEYIHLMADYKLNKEIRPQCYAFKQGIASVVPLDWLQMFNNKEMQHLISGAKIPLDVEDLKNHTNYAGGYGPEHPTIIAFWRVVASFNSKQKGQLLKFVTSCSRPPLLGFKELDPPFCIQHAGSVDRLPTSSTCMNLLKLPEFPDESTLREKLLYAIQAGAGFELS